MFILNALALIGLLFLLGALALAAYMAYSDLFGKTKSNYRMLNAIDFKERTHRIAEDQPEYITLPAYVDHEPEGNIVCCWQLTFMNRLKVLVTGKLWSKTMTFRNPFQPVVFSVHKSDVLPTNSM